jgi:hypothetical protein
MALCMLFCVIARIPLCIDPSTLHATPLVHRSHNPYPVISGYFYRQFRYRDVYCRRVACYLAI